jgi:hypothetical protein
MASIENVNAHAVRSARANADALNARRRVAAKYRPARVRLLLVAEAPSCHEERHFYFEDVDGQDSLFRYVYQGVFNQPLVRDKKAEQLARLRDAGVFLIETSETPIPDGAKVRLSPGAIDALPRRCLDLKPDAVVLIRSNVYDVAFDRLRQAGLNVVDARMPFPASGQQRKFAEAFAAALARTPLAR